MIQKVRLVFVLSLQMIIFSQQTKKVKSDSDSNSDRQQESENDIFQNKLKQRERTNKRVSYTRFFKVSLALIILVLILVTIFLVNLLIKSIPQTSNTTNIYKEADQPLLNNLPSIPKSQQIKSQQTSKKSNSQQQSSLQLNKMKKVQLKNSFFLLDRANNSNKNALWFIKRQPSCVPNQKIKLNKVQNGYLVNTAYEQVTLFSKDLSLQKKLYEFQGVRQLAKTISSSFPNKTMIFDHYDTYLLVLIARYFQQGGVFVTQTGSWSIMKKNLILNDLIALVSTHNKKNLIQKVNNKQILLTQDRSLLMDLLLKNKQLWIFFRSLQPLSLQNSHLDKMNIYQISYPNECQTGQINIVEKESLIKEDKHIILPGWYIFLPQSITLNFNHQIINYETPLLNTQRPECIQSSLQTMSYLANNQIYSIKLPFTQLHFFSKDARVSSWYKQVFLLLRQLQIAGSVYLQSGPCELFLIAVSSLKNTQEIYVGQYYKERRLLFKNLVLNNQQKVKVISEAEIEKMSFSLIITESHEIIDRKPAQKYLLLNNRVVKPLKRFNYTQITSRQCIQLTYRNQEWEAITQGTFLVNKNNK